MDKKVLLEIRRIHEMMYPNNYKLLIEAVINPIKGLDDLTKIFWTKGQDLKDLADDFAKNIDTLPEGSLSKSFMKGVEKSASYADEALDAFVELEGALKNGTPISDEALELLYKGFLNSDVFVDDVIEYTLKESDLIDRFVKGSALDDWNTIKDLGEEAIKEFKDKLKKLINDDVELPVQIKNKLSNLVDDTYKVGNVVDNVYKTMSRADLQTLWSKRQVDMFKKTAETLTEDDKLLLSTLAENNILSRTQERGILNSVIPGYKDILAAKKSFDKSKYDGTFKSYFFDQWIPKQNINKDEYLSKVLPWYKNAAADFVFDAGLLAEWSREGWTKNAVKFILKHVIVELGIPLCVILAGPIDCTVTIGDWLNNVATTAAEAAQKSNLEDYDNNILTFIDKFIDDKTEELQIIIPGTGEVVDKSFADVTPPITSGYDMKVVNQDGNDYLLELNEETNFDYNGKTYTYKYVMFEMAMAEGLMSDFYLIPEERIMNEFPSFQEFSNYDENNSKHSEIKDMWSQQNMSPTWQELKDIKISTTGKKIKFTDPSTNKSIEYVIDNDGNFKLPAGSEKKKGYGDSKDEFIRWANTELKKNWNVNTVVELGSSRYSYSGVEFKYNNGTYQVD
jgi:hypothetical protein